MLPPRCIRHEVFDVQELPTHGGSLRIFTKHFDCTVHEITSNVQVLLDREIELGITSLEYYQGFQLRVDQIKYTFWNFLIDAKKNNKKVIGYCIG